MPTSNFSRTCGDRRTWDRIALTGNTVERYIAVQNPMTVPVLQQVALRDPSIGVRIGAILRFAWPESAGFLRYLVSNTDEKLIKGAAEWQLRKVARKLPKRLSDSEKAFLLSANDLRRE